MGERRGVERMCADEVSLAGEGLGSVVWPTGGCSEGERGWAGLALRA